MKCPICGNIYYSIGAPKKCPHDASDLIKEIERLKKENEDLKKDIEYWSSLEGIK